METSRFIRWLGGIGLLAALCLVALGIRPQVGQAQTEQAETRRAYPPVIIEPPIWPPYRPHPPIIWQPPALDQELQLVSQAAHVDINGAVARTKLTQTFENTSSRTIEGTYIFPLPEGAAVSGFAMMVNGKRVEAEILDGDKARDIYTGIVQKMRDPGILEFIDRNLIRAKIFPIGPRAEQKVELEYSESLKADANSFRYVIPLRLPTGGSARQATVDINIHSPAGIRAVYSPTHNVEIKRDGDTARVSGEFGTHDPEPVRPVVDDTDTGATRNNKGGSDRDFVLYYTVANAKVGVNLITYHKPDEDGYFMLLVAPDSTIAPKEIAAKDVVFVCDTSGSMEGEKIEQTRRALASLLGNLNPDDRFNIITFSSDVRDFKDGLVPVSKTNVDAARDFAHDIKAVGGTNINDALLEALKMMKNDGRPQQIVFMTDGQPTVGETDVAQILKNVRAANTLPEGAKRPANITSNMPRLFVFGVGYDVNTRLLDTLAEDNRGASDYVLPNEDIEQKVGSLYSKIAYPVLADPRLDWGDMKVYDVYPKRLPDLFRGTQAVVFGRYEGQSRAKVQLIGTSLGHEERIDGQGDFGGNTDTDDTMPRLWAMRKVGYLVDDARRNGRAVDGEVRDEIVKLSKRYGIVTPFTAGLITDDGQTVPPPIYGGPVRPMPMMRGGRATYEDRSSADGATMGGYGGGFGNGAGGFAAGAASPAMPAPAAGKAAVLAARQSKDLRETDRVSDTNGDTGNMRYVEGKAFFLKDGVWTDSTYDPAKSPTMETVKFASAGYFALLKDASVARWLSLGDRVVVVLKNRTVKIEP